MTECAIMRIDKVAMVRVLHDEPQFTERFMVFYWPDAPWPQRDLRPSPHPVGL
jgi:hypothetical protein